MFFYKIDSNFFGVEYIPLYKARFKVLSLDFNFKYNLNFDLWFPAAEPEILSV